MRHNGTLASKGKPSPRSAVKPLSDEQVARLDAKHHLVDPTRYYPTGPRTPNTVEINAQNPKATERLLEGVSKVLRNRSKVRAWGLERVPETGTFITAASHVTMYDVFVPMMSLFHMGVAPAIWPRLKWQVALIGKWFQLVGMQPVPRRSGQARPSRGVDQDHHLRPAADHLAGRHCDPRPAEMGHEPQARHRLHRARILPSAGPAGADLLRRHLGCRQHHQWWPWPRKNVVMCYDEQLDYADLLADMDSWGEEPPADKVSELTMRVFRRMNEVMEEIRGERMPAEGYWDYRNMRRQAW